MRPAVEQMERVFSDLQRLLKTGQFERSDLESMEQFLTKALAMTSKVMDRADPNTPDLRDRE